MAHELVIKPALYPGVAVSSTFSDLQKHRQALIAAIGQSALKAIGMEDDAAKLDDVIDSSLKKVRDGSAYIGIIGHRYGQTPECPRRNPKRLSITELEFNEALRLKRPILLFVMADDHPVVKADVESDPENERKLQAFRERAKEVGTGNKVQRVFSVFNSVEDFRDKATRSLGELHALLHPAAASTATAAAGRLLEMGEWERADAQWQALDALRSKTAIAPAEISNAEYRYVQGEFWRHRLKESDLRRAEELAIASRNRRATAQLHHVRGEWKVTQGDWQAAARSLNEAVRMMREVATHDVKAEALLALAKFHLGQLAEPRQQAEELSQVRDPAHHALAELWLALGDVDRARHHALAAYRRARADGVPYVHRYALDTARALLERLGVEVPALPPYDRANAEPLPLEGLLVAYIDKLRAAAAERAAEDQMRLAERPGAGSPPSAR